MRWSNVRSLVGIASLAALMLSGCSGGGGNDRSPDPTFQAGSVATAPIAGLDADGDGFYTYDEYRKGVEWAIGQFQWPAGVEITSNLILDRPQGSHDLTHDRFQVGLETGTVQAWHACSWLGMWLDSFQAGIGAQQSEALDMVRQGFAVYPDLDPGMQAFIDGMLGKAALGDPSVVQMYINANCVVLNGYPWRSGEAVSRSVSPATASPVATPGGGPS